MLDGNESFFINNPFVTYDAKPKFGLFLLNRFNNLVVSLDDIHNAINQSSFLKHGFPFF